MTFKGNGLIYDPKKKKVVVNFNRTPEFSTDDKDLIDLLMKSGASSVVSGEYVEEVEIDDSEIEIIYSDMTKKDLVSIAKEKGITGADRMKKEEIIKALEG